MNVASLKGKVGIVTGAGGGIGAATAIEFAKHGARVVVTDILPAVEEIASKINADGGDAVPFVADILDDDCCREMVDIAERRFGRLDIALNNAGIAGRSGDIHEAELDHWRKVIDINLTAVFRCMKHQGPAMIKNGGGVIINTSSVLGMAAIPESSLEYTAAKHGVIGLTKQMALNHAKDGIRCLAICPGYIETSLTDQEKGGDIDAEEKAWFLTRIPQGRFGQPEDIARVVRMLCSSDADYMNGVAVPVDGGFLLS